MQNCKRKEKSIINVFLCIWARVRVYIRTFVTTLSIRLIELIERLRGSCTEFFVSPCMYAILQGRKINIKFINIFRL